MKITAIPLPQLRLTSGAGLAARLPHFITLMKPRMMVLAVFTALVGKNYAVLERGWLRTGGFLTWLVGIRSPAVASAAAESAARSASVGVVLFHRPAQLAPHPRAAADDLIEPLYCATGVLCDPILAPSASRRNLGLGLGRVSDQVCRSGRYYLPSVRARLCA